MTPEKPNKVVQMVRDSFPDRPVFDMAVTRAILDEISEGRRGETFRLYTPGRVVAFGRQDVVAEGYRRAVAVCRAEGFEAIERLAGGRAAVFHEGTLAFAWAIPTTDPLAGIAERFNNIDRIVVKALKSLGLDARVGAVPGEYCPGRYSVNLNGRWKVMGVGQRLRRGVAHVGGVVVVFGRKPINRVLTPVYRELSFDWNSHATGSVRAVLPDVTTTQVEDALVAELASVAELSESGLNESILQRADRALPEHLSPPSCPPG